MIQEAGRECDCYTELILTQVSCVWCFCLDSALQPLPHVLLVLGMVAIPAGSTDL